jgi:hypothetical protein
MIKSHKFVRIAAINARLVIFPHKIVFNVNKIDKIHHFVIVR